MVKSNAPVVQSLWRRHWPWALLLVAATVLVYHRMWQAGFIWDDAEHLTQNPCIIGPLGFKDIWTSSQAVYYPLVLTSFWALHKFVDLNPLPYHLLNVFMHAGSAVLLWYVLRQLGVRAAWLGAALWALHPVMVQSVAWITELKNTQSCFFYLLSILFFLKGDDSQKDPQRRWRLGLSLIFFVMAVTSKSATVMLPVVLVLCLWWRRRRLLWRDLAVLAPFFSISAAASGWTIWEQKFHSGALGLEWAQTWPERLAIAGRDVWFYLSKLLWPSALSFFYPQWKIDATKLATFVPLVAALGGLLLLWWKRNSSLRPVFVAAAYFVISLVPVLDFFDVYFFRFSFVSDHFQYLAAIGPLALLASGIASLDLRSFGKTRAWLEPTLVAALLLLLGALTWRQTENYTDAETLYRMSIERNPNSWPAYSNLGAIFLQNRQVDEAISYCRKAVEIKSDSAESQYNLGNCFLARGDFAQAIAPYQAALRGRPNNTKARNNLAVCLAAVGKINEALEQFKEAIRFDSNYAEAHYNLGYTLVQLGRQEEAVPHLIEAVRLKPDYVQAKQQLQALGVSVPPL
ncbi:MAG TPA: tetratricopeptide repeat protein [Chthoniobacterales bacterium]|nr:tetratricopeptide repeat protein [Chthoniobacterales bacterium]